MKLDIKYIEMYNKYLNQCLYRFHIKLCKMYLIHQKLDHPDC